MKVRVCDIYGCTCNATKPFFGGLAYYCNKHSKNINHHPLVNLRFNCGRKKRVNIIPSVTQVRMSNRRKLDHRIRVFNVIRKNDKELKKK